MPINIEALKAKLNKMNTKGQRGQKKFKTVLWTQSIGSHVVRIIPWPDNVTATLETPPFQERWFYYALGKRMVAAPLGQPDPVRELRDALYADRTPENLASAKKLKPKMRCYIPIIVPADQDEPDEGVKKGDKVVRLWSVNESVYKKLIAYMVDPDYGDITDPKTGRDITVDITDSGKKIDGQDKNFNDVEVRPKPKERALDEGELALLEKVPSIDEVAPFTPYEKLEAALNAFIDGGPTGGQVERGQTSGQHAHERKNPPKGSLDDAFADLDDLLKK